MVHVVISLSHQILFISVVCTRSQNQQIQLLVSQVLPEYDQHYSTDSYGINIQSCKKIFKSGEAIGCKLVYL